MKKYCLHINLIEICFSFDYFEADLTPDKSLKNLNFNVAKKSSWELFFNFVSSCRMTAKF